MGTAVSWLAIGFLRNGARVGARISPAQKPDQTMLVPIGFSLHVNVITMLS